MTTKKDIHNRCLKKTGVLTNVIMIPVIAGWMIDTAYGMTASSSVLYSFCNTRIACLVHSSYTLKNVLTVELPD
jgi:hypothetical protein